MRKHDKGKFLPLQPSSTQWNVRTRAQHKHDKADVFLLQFYHISHSYLPRNGGHIKEVAFGVNN